MNNPLQAIMRANFAITKVALKQAADAFEASLK